MFTLRNVAHAPVEQMLLQPNEELRAWTGFRNALVAMFDDEPAVAGWLRRLSASLGLGPARPAIRP